MADTHIFVDLSLFNNNISQIDSSPQPLTINDRRAQAYLQNSDEFYMSIARFQISSQLPLIIPQIKMNQPKYLPNNVLNPEWLDTIYSFTLQITNDSITYESPATYLSMVTPQNIYLSAPVLGIENMNDVYDNQYFYIDSVGFWVNNIVNPALIQATQNLIDVWNNSGPTEPRTTATLTRQSLTDALPSLTEFTANQSSAIVGFEVDTTQLTSPIYYLMGSCNYWVDTINSVYYLGWYIPSNIFPTPIPWVQNISASGSNVVVGSYEVDESYYTVTNNVTYQSLNYSNNYWQNLQTESFILNAPIFNNTPLAYNNWVIPAIGCLITYPNTNNDESVEYVTAIDGSTFRLNWVNATNINNNTTSGFLNNMLCAIVISSQANGLGTIYSQPNTTITSFTIDQAHLVISISLAVSSIPNSFFLTINPLMNTNLTIEASFNGYALLDGSTYLNPININWLLTSSTNTSSGGVLSFINQNTAGQTWQIQNVMNPPTPQTTNVYTLSFVGSFFTNATGDIEAITQWQLLSTQLFNIYQDETGIDNLITNIDPLGGGESTYTFTNPFKSIYQTPTTNNFSLGFTTVHLISTRIPLPVPISIEDAPYMTSQPNGEFQLVYPIVWLNDTSNIQTTQGYIYMNSSLYYLFNGFNALCNGYIANNNTDITNGKNFKLLTDIPYNNFSTNTTPPITKYFIATEYSCVVFWSPISNISFISSSIPIVALNQIPTIILGQQSSIQTNSSSLGVSLVITDFDIQLETGLEAKSILQYQPNDYKFIDLSGNRPLSELSFYVMWKDKLSGSLHTFNMSSGSSASVKLLFRKKSYYVGDRMFNIGSINNESIQEIPKPTLLGSGYKRRNLY